MALSTALHIEKTKENGCYSISGAKGIALSRCYELDRFPEDIELVGHKQDIKELTRRFCDRFGFTMGVAKDASTVKRCVIVCGELEKPLKIEVSYRNQQISEQDWQIVGGIKVYSIDALARMKAMPTTVLTKLEISMI